MCDQEYSFIRQLPVCACQGYKLAKGLRVARLFPTSIVDALADEVDSTEDYLTSYMLKQALIHCFQHAVIYTTPQQVAQLLYSYLETRLRCHGTLPCFFNRNEKLVDCDDALETPPGEQRACCYKRHLLLRVVKFVLRMLDTYCVDKGLVSARYGHLLV